MQMLDEEEVDGGLGGHSLHRGGVSSGGSAHGRARARAAVNRSGASRSTSPISVDSAPVRKDIYFDDDIVFHCNMTKLHTYFTSICL